VLSPTERRWPPQLVFETAVATKQAVVGPTMDWMQRDQQKHCSKLQIWELGSERIREARRTANVAAMRCLSVD